MERNAGIGINALLIGLDQPEQNLEAWFSAFLISIYTIVPLLINTWVVSIFFWDSMEIFHKFKQTVRFYL